MIGPRILGHATDVILDGVRSHHIDFGDCRRLLLLASTTYVVSAALSYLQSYTPGRHGAAHYVHDPGRRRGQAQPLSPPLRRRAARGDLLSRVTNDIDNVAQSLQQTLSQMLTSILTSGWSS